MASRTRKRPHRGDEGPNVLIEGDTGIFGGPQGGEEPGPTESGTLKAREYGVPQADIPGGVVHLANLEAVSAKPPDKARRPADYHKYHGVPSDDGQYTLPPDATREKHFKPEPEPKTLEAVPVYVVESPDGSRKIRKLVTEGPVNIPNNPVDPIHLAMRDRNRAEFWITNENSTYANGVRIGDFETCADNRGLFIPGGGGPQHFEAADEVYVTNTSGGAVTISFGYVTEVPASGA